MICAGRPTVREAESPGGRRKAREANAGGRKAAGNRDTMSWLPLLAVLDNWPDTGLMPGPGRALTRVR